MCHLQNTSNPHHIVIVPPYSIIDTRLLGIIRYYRSFRFVYRSFRIYDSMYNNFRLSMASLRMEEVSKGVNSKRAATTHYLRVEERTVTIATLVLAMCTYQS